MQIVTVDEEQNLPSEDHNLTPAHGPPEVNEGAVTNVDSKEEEENVEEMVKEEALRSLRRSARIAEGIALPRRNIL